MLSFCVSASVSGASVFDVITELKSVVVSEINADTITGIKMDSVSVLKNLSESNIKSDTTHKEDNSQKVDSLIQYLFRSRPQIQKDTVKIKPTVTQEPAIIPAPVKQDNSPRVYIPLNLDEVLDYTIPRFLPPQVTYLSRSYLFANPFFTDLRLHGYSEVFKFKARTLADYYRENDFRDLFPTYYDPFNYFELDQSIRRIREKNLRRLVAYHPEMIAFTVDKLPDVSELMAFRIDVKPIEKTVMLSSGTANDVYRRIAREKVKMNPWTIRSNAMLQFSQNYVSKNWYQGGSNNTAILGILNGRFNYDNKKNVQWDNFAEWRLGFNTVEGDTLRFLNTNDDILRATSKLGIKAGGNWFYSGTVDFQTQFFNSYRAINSKAMKTTFLTPVRFNMGVGLDYKYKKLFSVMVSPISYRLIYVNDTVNINKKSFGILPGDKVLSQIGSSFRGEFSYSPSREIQINSRLLFYTNYEKIEVDWEVVGNFTINRYLSTRLSLNPRYDNTVIMTGGEKAKLQFKQLLTFGLSYKLL